MTVSAVRLVFYRVELDGLNDVGGYESPWFGHEGGDVETLGGNGGFAVGLVGSAGRILETLGLIVTDQFTQRLAAPTKPLPTWNVGKDVATIQVVSGDSGQAFQDDAPEGGALVGMRMTRGNDFGGAVSAVQAIYQLADQYYVGSWCGQPVGSEHVVLAKPGYVVGCINARSGLVMDAIQLHFVRVRRGRLVADNTYDSEWVGGSGGSTSRDNPPEDRIIVGISARAEDSIESFSYQAVEPQAGRSRSTRPERESREVHRAEPLRTWTSADGKHTTEAMLVGLIGNEALLENAAGKQIRVPLEKLSEADQEYVQKWQESRRP